MRQLKILICELLLLVAFVGLFGFYALIIWGKREPDCPKIDEIRNHKYKTGVGTITASFGSSKWIMIPGTHTVKVYKGKWHKDYLEVFR